MGKNIPNIRQWLAEPASQAVLTRLARSVQNELRQRRIFSGWNNPAELDDIRSELVIFLLEKQNIDIVPETSAYLRTAFVNRIISQARMRDRDFPRYLYRQAAKALRSDLRFHTATEKGSGIRFSRSADAIQLPPFAEEDLREIAFPFHVANAGTITRRESLQNLAAYFLENLRSLRADREIRVSLRDFIKWIILYIPASASEFSGEERFRRIADPPQLRPDFETVQRHAREYCLLMTRREKQAFYLRFHRNMTYEQMARRMEYRSVSGPEYPVSTALQKLGRFLENLPGLSPDDLNPEAFALFCEALFRALENPLPEAVSMTISETVSNYGTAFSGKRLYENIFLMARIRHAGKKHGTALFSVFMQDGKIRAFQAEAEFESDDRGNIAARGKISCAGPVSWILTDSQGGLTIPVQTDQDRHTGRFTVYFSPFHLLNQRRP